MEDGNNGLAQCAPLHYWAGHLASYQEYIIRLGIQHNVHFKGKQSQFQNDLLESMAFILPSRREGMSNALLEAMSLGVTCIATDISGNQDLLRNKINGLLVPLRMKWL
ncbi:MAG: glycosyltransferase [Flammeovirgaceae bacterium]|nr:glycosyltransferase [Flammeovirgaceae bacterium]